METFTDDTVVVLASFLSPRDMLSLALTCKRFGDKNGTDKKRSAVREESIREVRQRTESISLMEVAARTVLQTKWTDKEKNALPRRGDKSWIGLYNEFLRVFRLPLQFDKLVGVNLDYVGSNKKSVVCTDMNRGHGGFNSAICHNIMRAGRHSVSFNVNNSKGDSGITLGIMRPTTKDITSLERCYPAWENLSKFALKDYGSLHSVYNVDCCLLSTFSGMAFCKRWNPHHHTDANDWEGREETEESSFKIGFILDLDEGKLDVYKNDRRLGSMVTGLAGEFCWVVSLRPGDAGDAKTVSIGR